MFEKLGGEEWRISCQVYYAVASDASGIFWPNAVDSMVPSLSLFSPLKKSLERAVFKTHEHTIVFEGNVLPARNTVCSWPGKYESAWDSLAEGSQHFGSHDQIPAKQDLQDLQGEILMHSTLR